MSCHDEFFKDKDSLFSSEESEEAHEETEEQQEVSEDQEEAPLYSEEDLQLLVEHVKNLTQIHNLTEENWSKNALESIRKWILDSKELVITMCFYNGVLNVINSVPSSPVSDLFYFLRLSSSVITLTNFNEIVNYGTLTGDIVGDLINSLQLVYGPVLYLKQNWAENVKSEFCTYLNNLLAKLYDIHFKLNGITILYVPSFVKTLKPEEVLYKKKTIKLLEAIVAFWIKQIRTAFQDSGSEAICPQDEYDFWTFRYENLLGLKHQFEDQSVNKLCMILKSVQSTYIQSFFILKHDLNQLIFEAKSNIEFLHILLKPCENLAKVEDPILFLDLVPEIINLIRFIWLNSPFYNTQSRITSLFKSLSNQIIEQLRDFVNLKLVFKEKLPRKSIEMFQTCIQVLQDFRKLYFLVKQAHELFCPKGQEVPSHDDEEWKSKEKERRDSKVMGQEYTNDETFESKAKRGHQTFCRGVAIWDLDSSKIFNEVEGFIRRCYDMIEVCEAMIAFGFYDEDSKVPKPLFCGSQGHDYSVRALHCKNLLDTALGKLQNNSDIIFEVKSGKWHNEILDFRKSIKNIEIMIENLVEKVFGSIGNVQEGVESLAAFYGFYQRKNLRNVFKEKTELVFRRFQVAVLVLKRDTEESDKTYPALAPYYSGRALLLNIKKTRVMNLKARFDNCSWMLPCSLSQTIFNQYFKLIQSIEDRILNIHRNWLESLGELSGKLNRSLLSKSTSKPGLIECNIDRSLIKILQEIRYWNSLLNFEVPTRLKVLNKKRHSILISYEFVLNVAMNYNKIVSSLSDEEKLLFKPLISKLDKRIAPGFNELTWENDIVDEYIQECSQETSQLQLFLDDYKRCNWKIVENCEKICQFNLISFDLRTYELKEFNNELNASLMNNVKCLVNWFQEVVEFLIVVFEGFEPYLTKIPLQWIKYVNNFDVLLEESLKICCKNSLEFVLEVLQGPGSTGPNPLIKLKTQLTDSRKIEFFPSPLEVADVISGIFAKILQTLPVLKRLNSTFYTPESQNERYCEVLEEDEELKLLQGYLNQEVEVGVAKLQEYLKVWSPFRDIWEIDNEFFLEKFAKIVPNSEVFEENLQRFVEIAHNVEIEETLILVHFFNVNSKGLKDSVVEFSVEWQNKILELLFNITREQILGVYSYIFENTQRVKKEPVNLKEMQEAILLLEQLQGEVKIKELAFPELSRKLEVLDKHHVMIPFEIKRKNRNIPKEWQGYNKSLSEAEQVLSYTKETFQKQVLEQGKVARKNSLELWENFCLKGPFYYGSSEDSLKVLEKFRGELKGLRENEEKIRCDLQIFGISFPISTELKRLEEELTTLELIWKLVQFWELTWEESKWKNVFTGIDLFKLQETSLGFLKKFSKLRKELHDKNWRVLEEMELQLDEVLKTFPVIQQLKNPAFRERHWHQVHDLLGRNFEETSDDFNLDFLIRIRIQTNFEEIEVISQNSEKELKIEQNFNEIVVSWQQLSLELKPYKNLFKIINFDEVFTKLVNDLMLFATMKQSQFGKPFINEIAENELMLTYFHETLELIVEFQKNFLSFERIFLLGEDIQRQIPKEFTLYERLSLSWVKITSQIVENKLIFEALNRELYSKLEGLFEELDFLKSSLRNYFETKRLVFPRFYFVGDEELFELLGVKYKFLGRFLKKLFSNVALLKFQEFNNKRVESLGMQSSEGEFVEFFKKVALESPIEVFLVKIEVAMKHILKLEFKTCRWNLKKDFLKREKWLELYCGQVCLGASLIQWTYDCTKALILTASLDNLKPLRKLKKKQDLVLENLTELSRRDLSKITRLKLNPLILIEVHSRDLLQKLYKLNTKSLNSFEWLSQMRFYWDQEANSCLIKQTNSCFNYNFEFTSNSGLVVLTPLTDKCFLTLTTCLKLFQGAFCTGIGKTKTVSSLAKLFGVNLLTFQCLQSFTYETLTNCLKGLVQTGTWISFLNLSSINLKVLSVFAQQLHSIFQNLSQNSKNFVFESSFIKLHFVGVFVLEDSRLLPDFVRNLLRPVSFLAPHSNLIVETILLSHGFLNVKTWSKKICFLYDLCGSLFEGKSCFSLRSLIKMLNFAALKRRLMIRFPQEQILVSALKTCTFPCLNAQELTVFQRVLFEVIPEYTLEENEEFKQEVIEFFNKKGFQPLGVSVDKVVELKDLKNLYKGVVLLGKTGSGKSTSWKTLQEMLKVQSFPINCSVFTLQELYGKFDENHKFHDGLLSNFLRKLQEFNEETWVVFDGESLEHLNCLLNDCRVLNLLNNERVFLGENLKFLFETDSLSNASPSLISRCGVVFHCYDTIKWVPFVSSFLEANFNVQKQAVLMGLFQKYLPSLLDFKEVNFKRSLFNNEFAGVKSLCDFLLVFWQEVNEDKYELAFLFCLVWSVCCTEDLEGRKKLDVFLRRKTDLFPVKETVFEYSFNKDVQGFAAWKEQLPFNWTFDPEKEFCEILVPCVDTVRYGALIGMVLGAGLPVLLAGPVGVGKSFIGLKLLEDSLYLSLSPATKSQLLQEVMESRLCKESYGSFAPLSQGNLTVFLDDFHENTSCQQLVKHFLDYGFWFDRQNFSRKFVKKINFFTASQDYAISPRLLSRLHTIKVVFPGSEDLSRIFGMILDQHLLGFCQEIKTLGKIVTQATINLFNQLKDKLKASPSKVHYLFNLRHLSKIFQGLLLSDKSCHNNKSSFLRLWIHETARVLADCLVDFNDKTMFLTILNEEVQASFDVTLHSIFPQNLITIHTDLISSKYEESDCEKVQVFLEKYNVENVILFEQAIENLCKIVRVLKQRKGNLLLIGLGGLGKSSLARLASQILELKIVDDVKKVEDKTMFLMNNDLINEELLEELNRWLSDRFLFNWHLVFCLSPQAKMFYETVRILMKNCSILYFEDWPKEALLDVASKLEVQEPSFQEVLSEIHLSCLKLSRQVFKKQNFITPSSYLELLINFKSLLKKKQASSLQETVRLEKGLTKIKQVFSKIEDMSQELQEAQKQISEFQLQCDEWLVMLMSQKKEADEKQREVVHKSIKIQEEEAECEDLKDLAQADLDLALPALEAAVEALDSLSKKDLSEIKSYTTPPEKVKIVMESICILLGLEPNWTESKKLLSDVNLIKSLKEYKKDNISEKTMKKIAHYTKSPQFNPDKVGIVSSAAKSLCLWVLAIEKYAKTWKFVAPKQAKLNQALETLQEKRLVLSEAQAQLAALNAMLSNLQKNYEEKLQQKQELNLKSEKLKESLQKASILTECLSEEQARWTISLQDLKDDFKYLPGQSVLCQGFLTYLGPFPAHNRKALTEQWLKSLLKFEVLTQHFNLISFFVDLSTVRQWHLQGLPNDEFSTENAVIITQSTKWPLILDPQSQALSWVKKQGLKIVEFQPNLNFDRKKGFLVTKVLKPLSCQVLCNVTFVNFAVVVQGLEGQLLHLVVQKEKPFLEEKKAELVSSITQANNNLKRLELELLALLNESSCNFLEDQGLLNTLQTLKVTSQQIFASLQSAQSAEVEIDGARHAYGACSERAALIFFVLQDLAQVNVMYQFSLEWYLSLFEESLKKARKSTILDERIAFLNEFLTLLVFEKTCIALYEKDKPFFAFYLSLKIEDKLGKIVQTEYELLLQDDGFLSQTLQYNPYKEWLSDLSWNALTKLDQTSGFYGVLDLFEKYPQELSSWTLSEEPEKEPLIGPWKSDFHRIIFVKVLRFDRFIFACRWFTVKKLGPQFVQFNQGFDLQQVFEESSCRRPIIFVLSRSASPQNLMQEFAQKNGKTLRSLSLGFGQETFMKKLLQESIFQGNWVFLINFHLSNSLNDLLKVVKFLQSAQVNEEFRLFLSCEESSEIPFEILQAGVKVNLDESPGVKSNLTRLYKNIKEEHFNEFNSEKSYKTLLFSLCFFHAVLTERRQFVNLGWNASYEFNVNDFNVAQCFLRNFFLKEFQDKIPLEQIKYLVKNIYAGHLVDCFDVRLLNTFLEHFFCKEIFEVPFQKLSSLNEYYVPKEGSLYTYQDYVSLLPNWESPEVFGLHKNANMANLIEEGRNICNSLFILQNVSEESCDFQEKQDEVLQELPQKIVFDFTKKLGAPSECVFVQEIRRYNKLINFVTQSLDDLQKALFPTQEQQDTQLALQRNQVPVSWNQFYPSLKPLSSWLKDLKLRVEYFNDFAVTLHLPKFYWLSAHTSPKSFLTSILEETSNSLQLPFETLAWDFEVLMFEPHQLTALPDSGIVVQGLYLEGASWSKRKTCLMDLTPLKLIHKMPLIHFFPVEEAKKRSKGLYCCPCYYCPRRSGNFVVALELKTGEQSVEFWVKRGVALLLSLSE